MVRRNRQRFEEDIEEIERCRGGIALDNDVVEALKQLKQMQLLVVSRAFRETYDLGVKAGVQSLD